MKKAILIVLIIFIFTPSHAFKLDFESAVYRIWSKSVVKKISYQNNTGTILFNINDEYFGTGDKINKICAIDSARLFMYVPDLTALYIAIPLYSDTRSYKRGVYILQISRLAIEQTYKLKFDEKLTQNNREGWRRDFINKYDQKRIRAIFAKNFVQRVDP